MYCYLEILKINICVVISRLILLILAIFCFFLDVWVCIHRIFNASVSIGIDIDAIYKKLYFKIPDLWSSAY